MANPQWLGVGHEPQNQTATSDANYTVIWLAQPCDDAGYITKIECYVADDSDGDLQVGVFSGSGYIYSCSDYVTLPISNGLNQFSHEEGDFDAADLPIGSGDYFGWFITDNGTLDRLGIGASEDQLDDSGDQIPCSSNPFAPQSNWECEIRVYVEDAIPTARRIFIT